MNRPAPMSSPIFLGPSRGAAENLLILFAMALVAFAIAAALFWTIPD
jgi:hypothetical protein